MLKILLLNFFVFKTIEHRIFFQALKIRVSIIGSKRTFISCFILIIWGVYHDFLSLLFNINFFNFWRRIICFWLVIWHCSLGFSKLNLLMWIKGRFLMIFLHLLRCNILLLKNIFLNFNSTLFWLLHYLYIFLYRWFLFFKGFV